ncbi:MAG: acyl-CoA thioesterase [Nodosilinea sp.]
MGFSIDHSVRFHETDAAGVVYFAHSLTFCHSAYEASLAAAGVNLVDFFTTDSLAYPIVHAAIEYRRPMRCGDRITIYLTPRRLDISTFEVHYRIYDACNSASLLAEACTRHLCIDRQHRSRQPLASPLEQWLQLWAADAGEDGKEG